MNPVAGAQADGGRPRLQLDLLLPLPNGLGPRVPGVIDPPPPMGWEDRKRLAVDNALPEAKLIEVSRVYTDIAEKITSNKIAVSENQTAATTFGVLESPFPPLRKTK